MADTTNKQPLAIRTSEEVKERFKNILEAEPGVNAGEILERLLNVYDTSKQEANLPAFSKDFKDFETHLTALSIRFHNAYEMIANAEESAMQKFSRDLEEKSSTIFTLNEQIKSLKEEKTAYLSLKEEQEKSLKDAIEAKQSAEQEVERLEKDKEDFRKQIDNLNSQISTSNEREKELNSVNADLNIKLKESESLQSKIASLERSLSDEQHKNELKELELNNEKKSLNDVKSAYNKLESENEKLEKEIDSLKDTITSLKEAVAQMNYIKTELEEEKQRANELQNKLFSSVENKTSVKRDSTNKSMKAKS